TALEYDEWLGSRFGPVLELVEEATLADSRFADDENGIELGPFPFGAAAQVDERALQRGDFIVASDHARLDAFDAPRGDAEGARLRAQDDVAPQRLVGAFDVYILLDDVEHA